MRQKKRKTTEKETRHQRRHDSLHCPKDTGKAKQITNWSRPVLTFKGKLEFYRYKIVKYKPRAFSFQVWRALKKLELHSAMQFSLS